MNLLVAALFIVGLPALTLALVMFFNWPDDQ